MQQTTTRLLTAILVSLTGAAAADAHAFLSQAVPPVGGVISASPSEIRITFTDGIEPAFSGIELASAEGQPIKTGPATVDPRDNTQLVLPVLRLGPGQYRVTWHVVSVDMHRTEGAYGFQIKP
jgi:methionine-rich copper-binding protein CopC